MAKRKASTAPPVPTLVAFLLDRTGSMARVLDATLEGFNAYLDGLKASGEPIQFSLIQFDSMGVDTLHKNAPVAAVPPLTKLTFQPRGSTPLIDAAYKTIKAVEAHLATASVGAPVPKVVVCIQTDGEENCSTEYTWAQLHALIKEKTAAGWQFNFMGCGIDAYAQGARMGVAAMNTMSYDIAADTTRAAFRASAANTSHYASGMANNTGFSIGQKLASGDKYDPDMRTPAGRKAYAATDPNATPPAPPAPVPVVDDITL